jgi:hypothetical protein
MNRRIKRLAADQGPQAGRHLAWWRRLDCWFSRRHHYFAGYLALGEVAEMKTGIHCRFNNKMTSLEVK